MIFLATWVPNCSLTHGLLNSLKHFPCFLRGLQHELWQVMLNRISVICFHLLSFYVLTSTEVLKLELSLKILEGTREQNCGIQSTHQQFNSPTPSLVMFILLYSPWDPYKLVGNKKNFFFLLKISSRKPSYLKKSDQLTWWVFTIRCRTITRSRLKLFW